MLDEPVASSPTHTVSVALSESTTQDKPKLQNEYINEIKQKPKINSSTFSEQTPTYSETASDETIPKRVLPSKTIAPNKLSIQSSIIDTQNSDHYDIEIRDTNYEPGDKLQYKGSTEINIKDESKAAGSSRKASNQKLNVRFISKDTGYVDDHQQYQPYNDGNKRDAPLAGQNIRQNTQLQKTEGYPYQMKEVEDSRERISSEFVSEDLSNLTPSNIDGKDAPSRPKKKLKRTNPKVKHSNKNSLSRKYEGDVKDAYY